MADPQNTTDPFAAIAQPTQADPFASIAQPAAASTSPPSNVVNPAAKVGMDLLKGVGEGVADTVHGTGELIRRGLNAVGNLNPNGNPNQGDTLIPPSGQQSLNDLATPTNTAQKVGKTAEDVGEFVAGDEALKTLSLGKRALEAANLAEKYEKASPFVKAAIEHTMNAVRQGTVAGTQQTAKTGDVGAGLAAGGAAAASNVVVGPALDLAGEGLKYVRAVKAFKDLPAALDKGISQTVSQKAVADGLKATTGTTAAEHLADSALQYQTRAKAAYQMVDNAVNGELQPVQDKLRQINKAIKMSIDPEVTDKLMAQQEHYQELFKDAIERAKANGVPDAEDIIKKADQDYTKFRAQSDLSTRLQKAAGPNGAASPAGLHVWSKQLGTPKIVGGTSRLAQALGPDGAEAVQKIASEGRAKATELASQAATAKKVGIGAAAAVGAGGLADLGYRVAH